MNKEDNKIHHAAVEKGAHAKAYSDIMKRKTHTPEEGKRLHGEAHRLHSDAHEAHSKAMNHFLNSEHPHAHHYFNHHEGEAEYHAMHARAHKVMIHNDPAGHVTHDFAVHYTKALRDLGTDKY